jgi:hypothetical protein
MYTIIDDKHKNVLYTGLSVEQRQTKLKPDNRFLLTESYDTTPQVGKTKLDTTTHDFVTMTWTEVKACRDRILAASDWRDLPSYAGSDQAAWRTYRQKLRDLPQDYTNVKDIVFPTEP